MMLLKGEIVIFKKYVDGKVVPEDRQFIVRVTHIEAGDDGYRCFGGVVIGCNKNAPYKLGHESGEWYSPCFERYVKQTEEG